MSRSESLEKQHQSILNPLKKNKNKSESKSVQKSFSVFALLKKHLLFALIFALLILIKPALSQNELAQNLEREFNRIATSFPENWEKYFYQITSTGQIKIDKFNINDIEHRLKKVHRFRDDIVSKFLSIVYADYVTFKTFSFSVSTYYSGYQEFVGAARIIDEWVEIAYIEINSSAVLLPQYHIIPSQRCHKVLFVFKKCENYNQKVPRGYTFGELELLLDTMKAHSYMHLVRTTKNILNALQTKEFVLSMDSPYYSEDGTYFLLMQSDGNLVIYQKDVKWWFMDNKPVWNSHTFHFGKEPYMLVIEKDGELVIYDAFWVALWKAGTAGKGIAPRRLVVTGNGELQLVDFVNQVLWKSKRERD